MGISIAYIQTPFHLRTFLLLLDIETFKCTNWIIFYDKLVEKEIKIELEKFRKIEVNIDLTYYGNDRNIFYVFKRIKLARKLRSKIQKYSQLLNDLIQNTEITNYVCFSERNVFSQLVLNTIKDSTVAWSVDEGFAHYLKPEKFDCVKKIFYPLLTPLVLGFSYQYYRVHGTHRRFNNLVLRLPSRRLVITSAHIISFDEIGIDKDLKKNKIYRGNDNKSVLILTSPYESGRVYNEKGVKSVIRLINDLLKLGYELYIKPHPREHTGKYGVFGKNIVLIDKSIPFEDIDYFQYSFVVSEISSTAIELLSSNYPKEKLIFLNIGDGEKQLMPFFKNSNMLYYDEAISKFISDKA